MGILVVGLVIILKQGNPKSVSQQSKIRYLQVKLETFAYRCLFKCKYNPNIHRNGTCIRATKQANPLCQSLSSAITHQLPTVGCPRKANNAHSASSHVHYTVQCLVYNVWYSVACALYGASHVHYTVQCLVYNVW